ncbi:class I SAM-dependent methyltransferase [Desulfosporosinus sp.]|uniref:class I SAM-dependent methyltransferase n=1 Tax=Desulfosporosinus sp. TaxID=157907 RepID=UPI0023167DB1|nr:class I SAM-dependent methyltransferase [Desulfosporosinus sp.]MCO5385097.1 class I SAM-dependent methyltransferase [Desulfosporosinus sp.]MDA8220621.1 class I SAM-dependent methyltransferase [Desulfitobacterium hafniense]
MTVHKFDPENRKKLNSKQRQAILPPIQVLMDIGLGSHDAWADIGCGTGFFTIPLANEVKQVYALDIRSEMLSDLSESLNQLEIHNVEVLQSEESRFPLPNHLIDGVLTSLVLHEVDQPIEFFRELNRILQMGGRLVVIEWAKASTKMGPPLDHRLSIQQLDDWALETGFIKVKSWQWSENFIGIEYCKER